MVCLCGLVSAPAVALDRPEPDLRSNIEESVTVRRVHVPVFIEPTKKGRRDPGRCASLAPDDVVVFLDADYSDHPEELPLLLAPIAAGTAELVMK